MEQSGFNYASSADSPRKLDTKQVVVGKNLTIELEMNNITTLENIFGSTYIFLTSYTNIDMKNYQHASLAILMGKFFQGTRC